jgi:hypothetical protein
MRNKIKPTVKQPAYEKVYVTRFNQSAGIVYSQKISENNQIQVS